MLVHLPLHASWLNQIEIYFSIVQRKLLEPNDFHDLPEVAHTLNSFERHWSSVAEPFDWRFTRQDIEKLMRVVRHADDDRSLSQDRNADPNPIVT